MRCQIYVKWSSPSLMLVMQLVWNVEQLFNAGVPVDTVDCDNNTALHHACSHVGTSADLSLSGSVSWCLFSVDNITVPAYLQCFDVCLGDGKDVQRVTKPVSQIHKIQFCEAWHKLEYLQNTGPVEHNEALEVVCWFFQSVHIKILYIRCCFDA